MKASENHEPEPEPAYLSTGKVAKLLNRTPKTIRDWIERGYFPNAYRPPGGQWGVPESDVDAFLERMKAG